ncbi:MAG: sigma factor-like helix-turn-helix DNA-binding protein [Cyanobacteria bacterium P01_D01_bin.56]
MTITKQNAINALTTTQLRRVELYAQGLTYEEIAERENVGQSALSLSLTRARRKLEVNTTDEICRLLGLTCVGHGPVNQYTKGNRHGLD